MIHCDNDVDNIMQTVPQYQPPQAPQELLHHTYSIEEPTIVPSDPDVSDTEASPIIDTEPMVIDSRDCTDSVSGSGVDRPQHLRRPPTYLKDYLYKY